jgi:hypothetical protein
VPRYPPLIVGTQAHRPRLLARQVPLLRLEKFWLARVPRRPSLPLSFNTILAVLIVSPPDDTTDRHFSKSSRRALNLTSVRNANVDNTRILERIHNELNGEVRPVTVLTAREDLLVGFYVVL